MSTIRKLCAATLIFNLLGLAADSLAASPNPGQSEAAKSAQTDADSGRETFNGFCVGCHGLDAIGGQAPNIQRAPISLGDDGVIRTIKNGVPGTGMPAFAGLSDAQAKQIVAYLRSLANAATSKNTDQVQNGDPEKGRGIYAKTGCADCHTIDGEGGNLGPELTQVGSLRAPDYMRATLLNPGTDLPKGGRVARDRGLWISYLVFRAVTKDGETVEGMRAGEDSFDIVLEDSKGNFHSLRKSELRLLEKEPTKSFMPSYKDRLSAADLDDLVAYLASLKGAQ